VKRSRRNPWESSIPLGFDMEREARWQSLATPLDETSIGMETPTIPSLDLPQLTDILGLRASGLFPKGKEPSVRTLRDWTKLRRIPHHRVGHFVYYDPQEVSEHIRTKLKVPARG
jgi:hypothetical protein